MSLFRSYIFFFLNDTATTEIYTLSLHDALPICLVALADDGLHFLVKRVVAEIGAVLDEEFETADRAQPHYGRRRHGEDERVLDGGELFVQLGRDGRSAEIGRPTILKRIETEENNARIRRDAKAADAHAGKRNCALHAGQLQADVRHAADHRFRAVERSGVR